MLHYLIAHKTVLLSLPRCTYQVSDTIDVVVGDWEGQDVFHCYQED